MLDINIVAVDKFQSCCATTKLSIIAVAMCFRIEMQNNVLVELTRSRRVEIVLNPTTNVLVSANIKLQLTTHLPG